MLLKIGLSLFAGLLVFLGYVSTREGAFTYERSAVLKAPPEAIFPYLSDLRMGSRWSPYEKIDPSMKKTFHGSDAQVGSTMDFEGNREAGSGSLRILALEKNSSVDIRLHMTEPFEAENLIRYSLIPEEGGTRFTWRMSGDGGFMGKLISVFIDCDKMIGGQFEAGIANLKAIVEAR